MWLPLKHPLLGTWPANQACALSGHQTSDLLVRRPALSPLSHTSQGSFLLLLLLFYYNSPNFSPLLFPVPLPCHGQALPCCPCPWVTYTCFLTRPLPFFSHPLSPPLWSLSVCSLFPCLLFYFAHLFVLFIRFLL